jgi:hypothetical protein
VLNTQDLGVEAILRNSVFGAYVFSESTTPLHIIHDITAGNHLELSIAKWISAVIAASSYDGLSYRRQGLPVQFVT